MYINVDDLISRMKWARERNLSQFRYTRRGLRTTITFAPLDPGAGRDPVSDGTASCKREQAPTVQPDGGAPAVKETVTAPLAGVCHLEPETGGVPYVAIGDTIGAGQTLCVIEAMKVMTSVTAAHGGVLEQVLVASGTQVVAGAPILRIR